MDPIVTEGVLSLRLRGRGQGLRSLALALSLGAATGLATPVTAAIDPNAIVPVVDITTESGRSAVGELTSWRTSDGPFTVEHLAGRDASGNVVVFYWSPRNQRWKSVNASAEAGRKVTSDLTSWTADFDGVTVEHLAGHDNGTILVFSWSPKVGRWRVTNVTASTGVSVKGSLTSWTSLEGGKSVHHVAGVSTSGDLIELEWKNSTGWRAINITGQTGIPVESAIAAWQVRRGSTTKEYLAAAVRNGRLFEFRSMPGGSWQATGITSHTGVFARAGVTPWRVGDVEHLAGVDQRGKLRVLWRSREGNWNKVDVTALTGQTMVGRPAAWQVKDGSETVELLAGRQDNGDLELFWWKPSRDWQALKLSEITGRAIKAMPVAWLTKNGTADVEHLAAVGTDGRLRVLHSFDQPRRLTDPLFERVQGVKRMRNQSKKTLVVLWDPHFPDKPKPSKRSVVDTFFGGVNSVRDYFRENSMDQFEIVSAGVLGWYDADHPLDYYNGNGSRDKAVAALMAADPDFDFAAHDHDGDGTLQPDELGIVFCHPGQGGLIRNPARPLLDDDGNPLRLDGVKIEVVAELGIQNPPFAGIATHELSHLFYEAVDMYFTFFTPTAAGEMSLMHAHFSNTHFDPVHKLKAGWLRPRIAFRSNTYRLSMVEGSNEALVLIDPERSTKEYFIIENRWPAPGNYDRGLHDQGLAVWHVMEESEVFDAAGPPPNVDPDRWPAKGGFCRHGVRMVRPDLRPPFQNHKALYDGAEPGRDHDVVSDDPDPTHGELRWGDGTPSGFAIRNISPAGPVMTFRIEVPGSTSLAARTQALLAR